MIIENHGICHENGHDWCLLCGEQNPWSLRLAFMADSSGKVETRFHPHDKLQGYRGLLHGGIISAMLDAAMTHCLFHAGVRAVTGDMYVRFLHPVPCHETVTLRADILSAKPPLYRMKSELLVEARVMARAEARFMVQKTSGESHCS